MIGSNVKNFVSDYYDADENESFVAFGQGEGSSGCEIFTRIKFQGTGPFNGTFQEIRWSAPVNQTTFAGTTDAMLYYGFSSDRFSRVPRISTPLESGIVDSLFDQDAEDVEETAQGDDNASTSPTNGATSTLTPTNAPSSIIGEESNGSVSVAKSSLLMFLTFGVAMNNVY